MLVPTLLTLMCLLALSDRSAAEISNDDIYCKRTCLPKEVYVKAHGYMRRSKVYGNFSFEDTVDHFDALEKWVAPKELEKKFPYYLAGYDFEDQPVWIGEVGKYNIREQVEKGPEALEDLKQYLFQGVFRMIKSMMNRDTDKKEIRGLFIVMDWAGFDDVSQLRHIPTILFIVDMVRTYLDFLAMLVSKAVSINVSYTAGVAFDIVRPILGGVLEKLEIFGTNKSKWQTALRRLLPPETIPAWYGGAENFKPLEVYG